ncbi:MAG: hypothetical protein WB787_13365, partial [Candidatus Acidiferrales bacterium]
MCIARTRAELLRVIAAAPIASMLLAVSLLACPSALAQLSTSDHLEEPGFWPTQSIASRDQFAGSAACANCHSAKAASQKLTSMAGTSLHADDSVLLHSHPKMNFAVGKYHYQVDTGAKSTSYSVTDGTNT